jgi:hypothetical protein
MDMWMLIWIEIVVAICMDVRDYPDHSAANQQKTLAASGIPAIASSPPILRVHAEPAG